MNIIQTNGLTKQYAQDKLALDHLNLEVRSGEIFGYLGPNGAGKTTTIRLLLDLIRPTEGSASIFGLDVQRESVAIRARLGFLPAEMELWRGETAKAIMRHFAAVRGMRGMREHAYADELAQRLDFDPTQKLRTYSTGNKRKLGLILALMHQPDLVILDEPTSGLDPLLQQTFIDLMREAQKRGQTVFLSSHMLGEVRQICDRVGVLRSGKLVTVDTVEALTHHGAAARSVTVQVRGAIDSLQNALGGMTNASIIESVGGNCVHLRWMGDVDPLLRALQSEYVVDLQISEPSLEETFLTYYQQDAAATTAQKAEAHS